MSETKVCTKCGEVKCLSDFGVRKRTLPVVNSACKECLRYKALIYRTNNADKIRRSAKEYNLKNKENRKDWLEANKERRRKRAKEYYAQNRDVIKEQQSAWARKNKDWQKKRTARYIAEKRQNDPVFKLKANLRGRNREALKVKGLKKKPKP